LERRRKRGRWQDARAERLDEHGSSERLLHGVVKVGNRLRVELFYDLAAVETFGRRHAGRDVITGGGSLPVFRVEAREMHVRSTRARLAWSSLRPRLVEQWFALRAYFVEQDPTFSTAFVPALVLSALIFVRSPLSNYIFDEQEALLANPFVNGQAGPI